VKLSDGHVTKAAVKTPKVRGNKIAALELVALEKVRVQVFIDYTIPLLTKSDSCVSCMDCMRKGAGISLSWNGLMGRGSVILKCGTNLLGDTNLSKVKP
jgi:hypothetical protein